MDKPHIKFKGRILHDGDGLYLGTTAPFFRGGWRVSAELSKPTCMTRECAY